MSGRKIPTDIPFRSRLNLAQGRFEQVVKSEKIYAYNLYSTAVRGIGVQGIDQIKGRNVLYKVLNITYK